MSNWIISCRDRDVGNPSAYINLNFSKMCIIHPGRLTWTIMTEIWKIIFLSKWVICRFHVNLPGCKIETSREDPGSPAFHRSRVFTSTFQLTVNCTPNSVRITPARHYSREIHLKSPHIKVTSHPLKWSRTKHPLKGHEWKNLADLHCSNLAFLKKHRISVTPGFLVAKALIQKD